MDVVGAMGAPVTGIGVAAPATEAAAVESAIAGDAEAVGAVRAAVADAEGIEPLPPVSAPLHGSRRW